MARPNFIIVGAAKAGTTSLYAYLRQHPQVCMSSVKEPCYFSDGNPVFAKNMNEYEQLFHATEKHRAIGEASSSYLYDPSAAHRIKAALGDVKIIIVLRNPADRAYSAWGHQYYQMGYETLSFENALAAEEQRMSDAFKHSCPMYIYYGGLHYFRAGLYHQQVQRYMDLFGADQVHVSLFEDLASTPLKLCSDLFNWLDVDPDFEPVFEKHNAAPGHRLSTIHRLLLMRPRWMQRCYAALPLRIRMACYRIGRRVYRWTLTHEPRPALDPSLKEQLLRRYHADILALEQLVGRDLSAWYPRDIPQTSATMRKQTPAGRSAVARTTVNH